MFWPKEQPCTTLYREPLLLSKEYERNLTGRGLYGLRNKRNKPATVERRLKALENKLTIARARVCHGVGAVVIANDSADLCSMYENWSAVEISNDIERRHAETERRARLHFENHKDTHGWVDNTWEQVLASYCYPCGCALSPLKAVTHCLDHGEFVYIVRANGTGRIKIGVSATPGKRIKAIYQGSPVETCLVHVARGSLLLEQTLHKEFKTFRLKGEWFDEACLVEVLKTLGPDVRHLTDIGPL